MQVPTHAYDLVARSNLTASLRVFVTTLRETPSYTVFFDLAEIVAKCEKMSDHILFVTCDEALDSLRYTIVKALQELFHNVVSVDRERRLYVITTHEFTSCLGFDVAERQLQGISRWLRRGTLPSGDLGTDEHYQRFAFLMKEGMAHHKQTNERCNAELSPQLVGLEHKLVEVKVGKEKYQFQVGKSTGWMPCHLEVMPGEDGGHAARQQYDSVKVIKKLTYNPEKLLDKDIWIVPYTIVGANEKQVTTLCRYDKKRKVVTSRDPVDRTAIDVIAEEFITLPDGMTLTRAMQWSDDDDQKTNNYQFTVDEQPKE